MDWNVITTVYDQRGLRHARRFLSRYGEVSRTDFHNVLVLHVPDIEAFLEAMATALEDSAGIFNDISRSLSATALLTGATIGAVASIADRRCQRQTRTGTGLKVTTFIA